MYLLAVLLGLVCAVVEAQEFRNRPIIPLVPFPPGGPSDALAKQVARRLGDRSMQVVISNVPGAGGLIGVAPGLAPGFVTASIQQRLRRDVPALKARVGYQD